LDQVDIFSGSQSRKRPFEISVFFDEGHFAAQKTQSAQAHPDDARGESAFFETIFGRTCDALRTDGYSVVRLAPRQKGASGDTRHKIVFFSTHNKQNEGCGEGMFVGDGRQV
jgi:hypothetical protein